MNCPIDLNAAIAQIPAGAWAVGVSGHLDSVALLELLRARSDLALHVAHLDHETRAGESAADARFVAELAAKWKLPATIAMRSQVERDFDIRETNLSARYRAARFSLFRKVIQQHKLAGVILAHHADDQAETVLQRLLRGSGPVGLVGMSCETTIQNLHIVRPLLHASKSQLRALLVEREIAWREDSSNLALDQQRNAARQVLERHPELPPALVELAASCREMVEWLRTNSPALGESFAMAELSDLPGPMARESARRWLADRAGPETEITPAAIERLVAMASDAATPMRQHFPGGILVRRKGRIISALSASTPDALPPHAER